MSQCQGASLETLQKRPAISVERLGEERLPPPGKSQFSYEQIWFSGHGLQFSYEKIGFQNHVKNRVLKPLFFIGIVEESLKGLIRTLKALWL